MINGRQRWAFIGPLPQRRRWVGTKPIPPTVDSNSVSLILAPSVAEFPAKEYGDSGTTALALTPSSQELEEQVDAATVSFKFTPTTTTQRLLADETPPDISPGFGGGIGQLGGVNSYLSIAFSAQWQAQRFVPSVNGTARSVDVSMIQTVTPPAYDLILEVRDEISGKPGNVIGSATFPQGSIAFPTTSGFTQTLALQNLAPLVAGTPYWLVWRCSVNGSGNSFSMGASTSYPSYDGYIYNFGPNTLTAQNADYFYGIRFVDQATDAHLTLTPSGADVLETTEAPSVTLTFTPSATEVPPGLPPTIDSGTTTLTFTPSLVEAAQSSDASSCGVLLTSSASEVGSFVEVSTAVVALTPQTSEVLASTDAQTSAVTFTLSSAEIAWFTEASTALVTLAPSGLEVAAAPYVVSSSNFVAAGSVVSGVVPLPTGWQQNDVLYIFAALSAANGVLTVPSGYSTVVASFHSNSGTTPTSATMACYRKVLTASESAPTVQCTSGRLVCIGVLVREANTASPEDVAGTGDDNTGVAYPSCRAPSVTTVKPVDLLLCAYADRNGTNAATTSTVPPSGQIEIDDQSTAVAAVSNACLEVASEQLFASGATGTRTSTQTSSSGTATNPMGITVAVAPFVVPTADAVTVPFTFTASSAEAAALVEANTTVMVLSCAASAEVLASTDTATESLLFTPSSADVAVFADSATETFTLTPSVSEIREIPDSGTESFKFTPSSAELEIAVDSATAPLTFTPSSADITIFVDSATEPFALTPSGTETKLGTGVDAATASVVFTETATEVTAFAEASTVLLSTRAASVDVLASTDVATSTVVFTPSAGETELVVDAQTAPLLLVPSGTELRSTIYTDSATAPVVFSVSSTQLAILVDSNTTILTLAPVGVLQFIGADSAIEYLTMSPIVIEVIAVVDQETAFVIFTPGSIEAYVPRPTMLLTGRIARRMYSARLHRLENHAAISYSSRMERPYSSRMEVVSADSP